MLKPLVFFERQAKKLFKKYVSLKKDLLTLVQQLKEDPEQGTALGNNCYKVRLAIDSKGKGKSGGARIITYIVVSKKNVYLLSIYDKSEKENLSDKELKELLKIYLIKNLAYPVELVVLKGHCLLVQLFMNCLILVTMC